MIELKKGERLINYGGIMLIINTKKWKVYLPESEQKKLDKADKKLFENKSAGEKFELIQKEHAKNLRETEYLINRIKTHKALLAWKKDNWEKRLANLKGGN